MPVTVLKNIRNFSIQMKAFIKLLLIFATLIFTLHGFKILTVGTYYDKRWDLSDVLSDLINLEEVTYYDFFDDNHIIAIETSDKLLLYIGEDDDIVALKVTTALTGKSVKPITPFPWWGALIIIIAIAVFPFPRKKKPTPSKKPLPLRNK